MGLTELGFERPTYDDLLEAQIARAKELFGEDIDTNETTPLGKYIRLNVADLANAYEVLEDIYYARFPHTARGTSLDRLCPFSPRVPYHGVGTVACRIDAYVGSDEAVVSYGDGCLVQYYEVEVGEEASAYADVLTVVAKEGLVDEGVLVAFAQHLP